VKLVTREPETIMVEELLYSWPARVSSVLTQIEVTRAVRRAHPEARLEARIQLAFAGVAFLKLDGRVVHQAARLDPPLLRSLAAIHLASALSLGNDLGALLTFDRHLARAALRAGVRVFPEPSEN
jgi:uncharacterized protein